MKDLVSKIVRKFVDIIDVNSWQVLTPAGFKDIKTVNKTIPYEQYEIRFRSGKTLKCADTHVLITASLDQVYAKDSLGKMIDTDVGADKVVSVKRTGISENMYDLQLSDYSDHTYYTNSILSHNTTTYTIYALWLCMFFNEKKVMLLANKADTALEILSRIRLGYEYLPTMLKQNVLVWNKGELIFGNRSSIKGFSTSSDAARGSSANVVIADEFSFVPNNIASKVFESIYPVISSSKNSQFIIVSTPNGADPKNLYYDIWQKANSKSQKENGEGWTPFRFDWWDVPGRDEQWKANTIASIGQKRFNQEFGNEFLSQTGVNKLIDDDIIEKYRMKLSEYKLQGIKPKHQRILSQDEKKMYEFKMWHEFDPNHTYLASGDIAEGIGSDSSIIYIWDVSDTSKVTMCAEFDSNEVSTVEFAYIARKMFALYGDPWFIAERNGISGGMIDSLKVTYGYQNIVTEGKKGESGVYSHIQVKERACQWTKEMMTTTGFEFVIYDPDLLDEFAIFVKKDTKSTHNIYHALPGQDTHDDRVMSFIWMNYILQNDVIENYYVVCQTFTSEFGKIYPRRILPKNEYTSEQIKKINADPMYKEFLEFKQQVAEKAKSAFEQESKEQDDVFKFKQNRDQYFEDDDAGMWGSTSRQTSVSVNPNNIMPAFFIG